MVCVDPSDRAIYSQITRDQSPSMLRFIKQKAKSTSSGMMHCSQGIIPDVTTGVSNMDNSMRIVSHVPPPSSSVSVASSSSTSSSSGSSSQHPPIQTVSGNETIVVRPAETKAFASHVILSIKDAATSDCSLRSRKVPAEGFETASASVPALDRNRFPLWKGTVRGSGCTAKDSSSAPKRNVSFLSGELVDSLNTKRLRTDSVELKPQEKCSAPSCTLLATQKDDIMLSPLHVLVRQNIEVFAATEEDVKQPSPGRRVPVKLNQVGLRCIHCKSLKARERKKRAVCYPSSVSRVYHSVSDMKFAHFEVCQAMPKDLQERFIELKKETQLQLKLHKETGSKRPGNSNASTSQYYQDSALEIGLVDGDGAIFMGAKPSSAGSQIGDTLQTKEPLSLAASLVMSRRDRATKEMFQSPGIGMSAKGTSLPVPSSASQPCFPPLNNATGKNGALADLKSSADQTTKARPMPLGSNKMLLASEEDEQYLAPVHCFVRRHVEFFAATEVDLAAPAPGRKKPIVLGQVGVRCVHCAGLSSKDKVKRSVCYPPSVKGIYHAVSNIKHDHVKICRGMPEEARLEFQRLTSDCSASTESSGKRCGRDDSRPRVSNSTAHYYYDSAIRMGLHDTSEGIRFQQSALAQEQQEKWAALGGMEALVLAATDPSVRAAHEQNKPQGRVVQAI